MLQRPLTGNDDSRYGPWKPIDENEKSIPTNAEIGGVYFFDAGKTSFLK